MRSCSPFLERRGGRLRRSRDQAGNLASMGIQCALCHSRVDDSFAPGIGHRLDGWSNQDLNVGAIVALASNLQPLAELLGVSGATVRTVRNSWEPGEFDALRTRGSPTGRRATSSNS